MQGNWPWEASPMTLSLNKWTLSQISYRPWVPIPPWAEGTSQYSLLYGSLSSRWYWDSRSIGNVRQRPLVQRRGNWPWEASPMSLSAFHPLFLRIAGALTGAKPIAQFKGTSNNITQYLLGFALVLTLLSCKWLTFLVSINKNRANSRASKWNQNFIPLVKFFLQLSSYTS